MTDKEIRLAIAESLGWQWWEFKTCTGGKFYQITRPAEPHWQERQGGVKCGRPDTSLIDYTALPKYTEDLNAMHEVVMQQAVTVRKQMRWWLYDMTDQMSAHDATARQRAEAYLRTIGKWTE